MSETNIRVIARFAAKPDRIAEVERILGALIDPTRREEGCITYELLQNKKDATDFTFVEEWTSEEALEKHLATEHIGRCRAEIGDHVDGEADIRIYRLVR